MSKARVWFFSRLVAGNVLELCLVRFETFSYRNITDKDTMFVAICKAKIIVPAKRPLLQMLCCPPALGKGAVSGCFYYLGHQILHNCILGYILEVDLK